MGLVHKLQFCHSQNLLAKVKRLKFHGISSLLSTVYFSSFPNFWWICVNNQCVTKCELACMNDISCQMIMIGNFVNVCDM